MMSSTDRYCTTTNKISSPESAQWLLKYIYAVQIDSCDGIDQQRTKDVLAKWPKDEDLAGEIDTTSTRTALLSLLKHENAIRAQRGDPPNPLSIDCLIERWGGVVPQHSLRTGNSWAEVADAVDNFTA